jgi:hypothetical protein
VSRQTHSFMAFLRLMQMSRHQVFVFMEGKKADPYFYGKVSDSVCRPAGVLYRIVRSQELTGGQGGKQNLISFFEYLRRKSSLISVFKGKSTGILFFLDKDVDDFLGTQRRSKHVVYSGYYDVENHIFAEGDLIEAVAASASLDHQEVLACFSDGDIWRREVAERWKQWVVLCLFVAKKKVNCECNYGVTSRVNSPFHGPVDQAAYSDYLQRVQLKMGLTDRQFKRAVRRVVRLVDDIYAEGEYDRVFKGKWYALLLAATIRDKIGGHSIDSAGLEGRLASNAASTLDFDASWAEHFKEPLRNVIHQL